jgi:hypothetical protein
MPVRIAEGAVIAALFLMGILAANHSRSAPEKNLTCGGTKTGPPHGEILHGLALEDWSTGL